MLKNPSRNELISEIEQADTAARSITNHIPSPTNNLPPSTYMELKRPTTSKLPSKKPGPIQNPSSWLQSSGKGYLAKGQAVLDSIMNFTDPDDIARKYEDFVSFVHGSVAEIKKYIDSRPDITEIEGKLTKSECDQIRRDEQVNFLASQCQGWELMSDELQDMSPKTYKDLWPWLGSEDNRSACQYVDEFIQLVLPYCSEDQMAIAEFTDRLILEPDDRELFSTDHNGTFQQCVKKFIEKFSIDDSFCEITSFESSFPIDSSYYDFALFWLSKFRFNSIADPYWVLDQLIKKLPDRYESSLRKLKKNFDVSYTRILKTIYDRAAELKDQVPETCKYLGYHVIAYKCEAPSKIHTTDEINSEAVPKPKLNSRKKRLSRSLEEEEIIKQRRKRDSVNLREKETSTRDLFEIRLLSFTEAMEKGMEWKSSIST